MPADQNQNTDAGADDLFDNDVLTDPSEDETPTLKSLGERVRAARQARNMTIDDVAKATCIRQNFIQDIEDGDFSNFIALVYARGFVHAVLRVTGAEALWDDYNQLLTIESFHPAAISRDRVKQGHVVHPALSSKRSDRRSGQLTRGFRASSLRRNCLIALFAVVAISGVALWANWDGVKTQVERIQQQQISREAEAKAKDAATRAAARQKEADGIQAELNAAQSARQQQESEQRAAAEKAAAEKTAAEKAAAELAAKKDLLIVRATGECWASLKDENGKSLLTGTLKSGYEGSFKVTGRIRAIWGRGQNIQTSLNGGDFVSPGRGRVNVDYLTDGKFTVRRRRQ